MAKQPTSQGHNLWLKQPIFVLQCSNESPHFILQLCPWGSIPKKCMNWKIWSDEVRDSKLQLFQHLENSANCFDSMKHQCSRAFFTMIQVKSRPAMNIKVKVGYLSFQKCPRTSIYLTWARSYGFINKAWCNFLLR